MQETKMPTKAPNRHTCATCKHTIPKNKRLFCTKNHKYVGAGQFSKCHSALEKPDDSVLEEWR